MATIERLQTSLSALEAVQDRVLWLATSIIHHANRVRKTPSGVKVGGHQASSASVVSIMTALWFEYLRPQDRVSVKPHASPVLHAIEYLLGDLDRRYLTTLREMDGLQSYPSRLKDPVPADFSTGSVGIGATATIWSAIAHRYVAGHFEVPRGGRQVALLGDAELDEGACWEAIVDPVTPRLGEVLWIVDLNRQSLDRVVPEIAANRLISMFDAAGWQTLNVKYGRWLDELFERDGGHALRRRIDQMDNEEYQRLLRADATQLRDRLPGEGRDAPAVARLIADLGDGELLKAIRDLGGHDLTKLVKAFAEADRVKDRPSVVFAYTIKAWRLATEGHPGNHSALLTDKQWEALGQELGADPANPWATFEPGTPAYELCEAAARRLRREPVSIAAPPPAPPDLGRSHSGRESTQQALGRFFVDLAHEAPEVARRVVTVSPDVASSTNLGGWINRVGVWQLGERVDWFADDPETLVRWRGSQHGQHVELGIAEGNLVGLLAELGLTWSRDGQPLLPIGTLYDPFVNRALEPWSFGLYAGAQSILVGTPSGVTLAPEGGAHQSIITPSVGLEQPRCVAWEPAFGQDLQWALLHALSNLGRPDGASAYFRLTTRPIDQKLAQVPEESEERERRRRLALAGGYPLRAAASEPAVTLVAVGAVVPEAIAAAEELAANGAPCDVICLTSPDLIFRALQARQGLADGDFAILDELFPPERAAPLVTVLDGHPHTLGFLSAARRAPIACLGVTDFGQSGDVPDLYRYFGIDTDTIVGAALDLMEGSSMMDVAMPKLSVSMEEGTILRWLKEDGEHIAAGEEFVEIETDKATVAYAAETAGTVQIVVPEGNTVPVGELIARIGEGVGATTTTAAAREDGDAATGAPADVPTPPPATAAAQAPAAPASATANIARGSDGHDLPADATVPAHNARALATPLARRAARAHGIDLGQLRGSGPRGRITRGDVLAAAGITEEPRTAPAAAAPAPAAAATPAPAAPTPAPAAPPPAPAAPPSPGGDDFVQEPTRVQRLIARRMAEAKATIPDFEVEAEVVMDPALAMRAELKQLEDQETIPSVNDFVVKAGAVALRRHPRVNASYLDGSFKLHRRINVGVAVASEAALIVPVVRDADTKSLGAIANETRGLAARVRAGKITPPELSGGTFTVSNLGMFGMTAIRPVINLPQAAILGVGSIRETLARADGEIVNRRLMTLSLSADHRILYGADAARFLADVKALLESPLKLIL